eukprot:c118_g1_i1.p1 GENE.c118_g1_i1~~c118_g1_i1.p1  ORF type:complete len:327 (-),score=121.83 c118_g1_i1:151-1086(-)
MSTPAPAPAITASSTPLTHHAALDITAVSKESIFDVQYQSSVFRVCRSAMGLVRPKVKQRVMVNWKSKGALYPGKVVRCRKNKKFDILFDDGDKEFNVHVTNIFAVLANTATPSHSTNNSSSNHNSNSNNNNNNHHNHNHHNHNNDNARLALSSSNSETKHNGKDMAKHQHTAEGINDKHTDTDSDNSDGDDSGDASDTHHSNDDNNNADTDDHNTAKSSKTVHKPHTTVHTSPPPERTTRSRASLEKQQLEIKPHNRRSSVPAVVATKTASASGAVVLKCKCKGEGDTLPQLDSLGTGTVQPKTDTELKC